MDINNVKKIGEILKELPEISKNKRIKKSDVDFSKILDEELKERASEINKVHTIPSSQNLLNVKNVSTKIFTTKGLHFFNRLTVELENFSKLLNSDNFHPEMANTIVKKLQNTVGNLNSLIENIDDPNLRKDINRAMLMANIEIEKYLRGDYF